MARQLQLFTNYIDYMPQAQRAHLDALGEASWVGQGVTFVAARTKAEAVAIMESIGFSRVKLTDLRKADPRANPAKPIIDSELFTDGAVFVTGSTRAGLLLVEGETLTIVSTGRGNDMVIARP